VSATENYAVVESAPGGRYPADADVREMLALLDNGRVLVAHGKKLDQRVRSYLQDIQRKGVTTVVVDSDMDEVRSLYDGTTSQSTNGASAGEATDIGTSHRQEQVLKMIRSAVADGASDLHIIRKRVGGVSLIRQRVHGMLEDLRSGKLPTAEVTALQAAIYNSMCDVADTTLKPHEPQDARVKQAFVASSGLFGARVATRPTDEGLLMVLRMLYDNGNRVRSLPELGYSEQQAETIGSMTRRKEGVNIFAGATGSGKSTSLQVLMDMLIAHFERKLNVITLEDPPEYKISGANQTPVIGGDWAGGIRNLMRLDPDVIMVGEMRDFESAQAALRAAMTGHGVWTTLHANDAFAILQRLGDIGVDRGLMLDPSIMTGLINQSLVRVLCQHCSLPWSDQQHTLDRQIVSRVGRLCDPTHVRVVGKGCDHCNGRGVTGRTVVAEVVVPNIDLMRVFQAEGKAQARAHWVREMAGTTKTAHMLQKISKGLIDPRHAEENVGPLDTDDLVIGKGAHAAR